MLPIQPSLTLEQAQKFQDMCEAKCTLQHIAFVFQISEKQAREVAERNNFHITRGKE